MTSKGPGNMYGQFAWVCEGVDASCGSQGLPLCGAPSLELRDTTRGLRLLPVGVKAQDFIRAPEIELMKSLNICSKKLVWYLLTPCQNFMCLFMLSGKQ